jgi:hypothetical protein
MLQTGISGPLPSSSPPASAKPPFKKAIGQALFSQHELELIVFKLEISDVAAFRPATCFQGKTAYLQKA